jgi:tetratricopeptide (TPR) repeat protein
MELLKKTIVPVVMAMTVQFAHAGTEESNLQKAFSKSYTYEYKQKYDSAILAVRNVYAETSYECNLRLGWLEYLAGKYSESVTYYKKAIGLMPASTEATWGMINPLSAQEKWTEVEKCYLSILQLDPKNSLAHFRLGSIYYYRKDYVKAKSYFDVSLNLYPFDYDALLMSAWTDYFLGKTNEARTLFNKVLLNKPGDTSALEGLSLTR